MSLLAKKDKTPGDKKKPRKKAAKQNPAVETPATERDRDAGRKREQRAKSKIVEIPPCANLARRKRLEKDDAAWLRYYFPDLFWYEFTPQQVAMIEAIGQKIREAGDKAQAASRGEGKST